MFFFSSPKKKHFLLNERRKHKNTKNTIGQVAQPHHGLVAGLPRPPRGG